MSKRKQLVGQFGLMALIALSAGIPQVFGATPKRATPTEYFPLLQLPLDEPQVQPPRTDPPSAEDQRRWLELKKYILNDSQQRISPQFSIPHGLYQRTSFWFDIYTRYGENHHVIHHVRYPWIIYQVFDTTRTLQNGLGPLWLRRDRAEKLARKQTEKIRLALKRLARKRNYRRLKGLEKSLYDKLAHLPGPRQKVFREAAENVRSQLGQKDFFLRGLANSTRYLPHMEAEFRRAQLPVELTRLPFVESSFNENAYSKVGASGIWQIMPETGKSYLIVNKYVDERNSPLKATQAAAKILRSYSRALGDWALAVTAYNNGIGNIQKAIKHAGSRDLATIIARYHRGDFKFASGNFYTCFLAALHAERYHELLFRNLLRNPVIKRDIIRLGKKTRARKLPSLVGVSKDELLEYNRDLKAAYRHNAVLPKGFRLFVPPASDLNRTRAVGTQANRRDSKS